MEQITIRTLLNAGVHYGHHTRRWNPKMQPYIFTDKNGIYIIDLKKTMLSLDDAYTFVSELVRHGGKVLFVGTKKQAQESIKKNAESAAMPYVNHRWLGGMLTNFVTIRERVKHMEKLERMQEDGELATLPKKEQISKLKELAKLQANLNGVRDMLKVPDAIFVVDTKKEEIALAEAHRLGIPIIGMLDTNADPDEVEFGIPSNDDAIRSIDVIGKVIAGAAIAGGSVGEFYEDDFEDSADGDIDALVGATNTEIDSVEDTSVEDTSVEGQTVDTTLEEAPLEETSEPVVFNASEDFAKTHEDEEYDNAENSIVGDPDLEVSNSVAADENLRDTDESETVTGL